MKKILVAVFVFVICLSLSSPTIAAQGDHLDGRLKLLLNDETVPFYPDSIRWDFLGMGMKKCGTMCNQVGRFAAEAEVPEPPTDITFTGWIQPADWSTGFSADTPPTNIEAVLLKDDDYALMRIKAKDIAQKKIATSETMRYWYEMWISGSWVYLGVYPPPTDTTDVMIFGSVAPLWADTAYLNPAFENETVLYALYLCRQRQGEIEIANFIKQIAINEIMDLKAILENRPVDVTIQKEVVPR